ncbi:MAG: dUTP diphosphatase [Actinomycetota bacterium]|nr:dUTP diphosphatase [Actinomycetota bacterium]
MARPEEVTLRVVRLQPDAVLPSYAHPDDAGLDLAAATDVTLLPGQRVAVPTGLALGIPRGWVGLVHPRSGMALHHGVTVVNAPGTIDAGYRGEVQILLVNLADAPVDITRGDRVAQLLLQRVGRAVIVESDTLEATPRGSRGFGSSGTGPPADGS